MAGGTDKHGYGALLNNPTVYEQEIVHSQINNTSLNSLMVSDYERERWARHLKVCYLLCNTELKSEKFDSAKRMKKGSASGSSSGGSEFQPDDFKYLCIEMQCNQRSYQDDILMRNDLMPLSRLYDIYNKENGMFIEVKVSENPSNRYSDFLSYRDLNVPTGLAVTHPITGNTTYYDMEEMPGHEKVVKFILQRARVMDSLELNVNAMEFEGNMEDEIFPSQYLREMTKEFMDDIIQNVDSNPPLEDFTYEYKMVDKDELNDKIEDPRKRGERPIEWPGKLLPVMWLEGLDSRSNEDSEMITELFMKYKADFKGHWLSDVMEGWSSSSSTYCLFREKESRRQNPTLVNKLGIGKKARVRADNDDETKQINYGEREKMKYHFWFENLLLDFAQPSDHPIDVEHLMDYAYVTKMDEIAMFAAHRLTMAYSGRNIAQHVLYNINFYSRLAGSYAPKTSDSTGHSNVVLFPLYNTILKDKVKTKRIYGFLIRAPQHARNCNDKINMVIVELCNNLERTKMYSNFLRKHERIDSSNGCFWVIRQQAIEKMDPSYLTFIENSLYTPANLIGELILPKQRNSLPHLRLDVEEFIDGHIDWLMERVVEAIVIALTSRAADEGAFAMIRKVFMICIALKRNQPIALISVQEFAEKINECLLNNCMGMYYVCQLKDVLTNISYQRLEGGDVWKMN